MWSIIDNSNKKKSIGLIKPSNIEVKLMVNEVNTIKERMAVLPIWLDSLIFENLSATYCRQNKDMVVLDWSLDDIKKYLGTYFPRSYAEAFCIFSNFFSKEKNVYENCQELSIFDFGCGTGGELIGFIMAVSKQLPNIKKIEIRALDGNSYALRFLECILEKTAKVLCLDIESNLMPLIIDDFYDMQVVDQIITQSYDFIISFKAICEFVTKQQFEQQNPYEHIINVFISKLSSKGVICLADITSFNAVSQDWLPVMLDNASKACNIDIIYRNSGFNEDYHITHTHHKNDTSKIAWRIYKYKN